MAHCWSETSSLYRVNPEWVACCFLYQEAPVLENEGCGGDVCGAGRVHGCMTPQVLVWAPIPALAGNTSRTQSNKEGTV
jgi:hypothetical protein